MTLPFDAATARRQFPLLAAPEAPVYFDNAATTQKPFAVLDAERNFYSHANANAHRASHALARAATAGYEAARATVADFLTVDPAEIIFTRGTTESLNLLAAVLASTIQSDDVLVVTALEHHSNLLPWRRLAEQRQARLHVIPVRDDGVLDWQPVDGLPPRTRGLAVAHVSNTTGQRLPVAELCAAARQMGAWSVVDGAQAVAHAEVAPTQLGCDFYAFSGHKLYAPLGIGILWGRAAMLADLPPWQLGGGMVEQVTADEARWLAPPHRFEAGTPNIAGAIGLAAAITFLRQWHWQDILAHQHRVQQQLEIALQQRGIVLLGPAGQRHGVLSLVVPQVHPQDLGILLDQAGIAVRVGHHCAMPLMQRLGLPGTLRLSVGLYNTKQDVAALVQALDIALELLR